MMTKPRQPKGFTLLEALVASVILGAAVVTIGAISTRCLRQAQLSRQYETAWQLLDRQLTIIDYMGLADFLERGTTSGEIENFGPTYYWRAQVTSRELDDLHLVRMTISWEGPSRPYRVTASTLLNSPTGLIAQTNDSDD